jgi:purine-binding chemotaxis protein CheW
MTPLPPPTDQEVLRRRAQQFAQREAPPESAGTWVDAVEFTLGGERYAVPADHVVAVATFSNITALPGVPGFILGLVTVHGRIVPAVDLRRFLGFAARGIVDLHHLVLITDGSLTFALVADLVVGTRRFRAASLAPGSGPVAAHAAGVSPEGVMLLDVARFCADPRHAIDDKF